MADIKVTGIHKVKSIKKSFKDAFGVGIRFYEGKKFADDEATIASIRKQEASGAEITIRGNTLVKNVEKMFMDSLGVTVQIEDKTGGLANNDVTIASLSK
jgi:hypothetical protein